MFGILICVTIVTVCFATEEMPHAGEEPNTSDREDDKLSQQTQNDDNKQTQRQNFTENYGDLVTAEIESFIEFLDKKLSNGSLHQNLKTKNPKAFSLVINFLKTRNVDRDYSEFTKNPKSKKFYLDRVKDLVRSYMKLPEVKSNKELYEALTWYFQSLHEAIRHYRQNVNKVIKRVTKIIKTDDDKIVKTLEYIKNIGEHNETAKDSNTSGKKSVSHVKAQLRSLLEMPDTRKNETLLDAVKLFVNKLETGGEEISDSNSENKEKKIEAGIVSNKQDETNYEANAKYQEQETSSTIIYNKTYDIDDKPGYRIEEGNDTNHTTEAKNPGEYLEKERMETLKKESSTNDKEAEGDQKIKNEKVLEGQEGYQHKIKESDKTSERKIEVALEKQEGTTSGAFLSTDSQPESPSINGNKHVGDEAQKEAGKDIMKEEREYEEKTPSSFEDTKMNGEQLSGSENEMEKLSETGRSVNIQEEKGEISNTQITEGNKEGRREKYVQPSVETGKSNNEVQDSVKDKSATDLSHKEVDETTQTNVSEDVYNVTDSKNQGINKENNEHLNDDAKEEQHEDKTPSKTGKTIVNSENAGTEISTQPSTSVNKLDGQGPSVVGSVTTKIPSRESLEIVKRYIKEQKNKIGLNNPPFNIKTSSSADALRGMLEYFINLKEVQDNETLHEGMIFYMAKVKNMEKSLGRNTWPKYEHTEKNVTKRLISDYLLSQKRNLRGGSNTENPLNSAGIDKNTTLLESVKVYLDVRRKKQPKT